MILRSPLLSQLAWIDHGFGTRLDSGWLADPSMPMATLRQVHSANVLLAEHSGVLDEGDALVSNRPHLALVIRTADCLPLLVCADDGSEIAAIHAGWRGLAVGVIEGCIETLRTPRERLRVWLGPAIGASS